MDIDMPMLIPMDTDGPTGGATLLMSIYQLNDPTNGLFRLIVTISFTMMTERRFALVTG